jgi:hypothetical protein
VRSKLLEENKVVEMKREKDGSQIRLQNTVRVGRWMIVNEKGNSE